MVSQTLLVALATLMQAASPTQSWKPYSPPQGNYTVSLPAKPTEKKQPHTLPSGKVEMTVVSIKRGASYSISAGELSASPDDPAAVLDAARDELVKGLKGKLDEEKPCEVSGAPGRELKIDIPKTVVAGGAAAKARIALFDRKLYELLVVQTSTEAKSGVAPFDEFFASFKTTDKPADPTKIAAKNGGADAKTKAGGDSKTAATAVGAGKDDPGKPGWEKFTSADGGYSAYLPGKPTETAQKVNAPVLGEIEIHVAAVSKGPGTAFLVTYNDYPPGLIPQGNLDPIYDGSRQGALANSGGGTLAGEKKLMLGDLPGREIKIDVPPGRLPGGALMQIRYFLKGSRLYQILYMAPKADVNAEEAEAFLESFRITAK